MIKEEEYEEGVVSSMRKNLKRAIYIGAAMIFSSIGISLYSIISGKGLEFITYLSLLVTVGGGIISIGLGSKALQSKFETDLEKSVESNNDSTLIQ